MVQKLLSICQMLLVRFAQIDHVIIDRAYLRCSSLDQGQDSFYNSFFKNIFHIQSSTIITQQYNLIFHSTAFYWIHLSAARCSANYQSNCKAPYRHSKIHAIQSLSSIFFFLRVQQIHSVRVGSSRLQRTRCHVRAE